MGCCCSNGAKGDNWKENNGQYGGKRSREKVKGHSWGWGVSYGGDGGGSCGGDGGGSCGGDGGDGGD